MRQIAECKYPLRQFEMRDWKRQIIGAEWTLVYLDNNIEEWIVEHKCGGAIASDYVEVKCKLCHSMLSKKELTTIQLVLKKGHIKL